MGTTTVRRGLVRGGLLAAPVAAVLLAFAAVAFACVPQTSISLDPKSGVAGSGVTVTGSSFQPGASVRIFWGGISGERVATTTASADGKINVRFVIPSASPNGQTIVAANQVDGSGLAIGGPANALFNVTTPGGVTVAPAPILQEEQMANADGAAGLAPVEAALPAATAAPSAAPEAGVSTPATTPAPRRSPTATPATGPVSSTRAAVPAPAADAVPAPAVAAPSAPAAAASPAPPPARREAMVRASDGNGNDGLSRLAVGLVVAGLALAVGASAVALASRPDARRPRPSASQD